LFIVGPSRPQISISLPRYPFTLWAY
jgi:hypothetical protein